MKSLSEHLLESVLDFNAANLNEAKANVKKEVKAWISENINLAGKKRLGITGPDGDGLLVIDADKVYVNENSPITNGQFRWAR